MRPPTVLAVHGHFYQPPRENPWTEEVPREPSAAPYHDWNERIAAECYRANAFARVVDDRGRVVSIVNNYRHLSFDFGPTLTSWLEAHHPEVLARVREADASTQGGLAQAYYHVILPLASERDVRTLVRWGLAEFAYRFGRPARGLWLPETAVNADVLRVLAQEGVAFTILAPAQAAREVDVRRPYRWVDPTDPSLGLDVVFYDGALSHAVAFELSGLSSQELVGRVVEAGREGGLVALAADGETFGHHHRWGDRLLAYALAAEAPRRGVTVGTVDAFLRQQPAEEEVGVVESAWSCAHGVARWREDCGCSTGGAPGWNQRWRAPLRDALDLVRGVVDEVFARRGREVLGDPWAARDDYVGVLLGSTRRPDFAARHVVGDPVVAFTLLEAQRHALAMYTSCGWFFNDLAGLETVQVLRYAARALDCLEEVGEVAPTGEFLAELARATSNDPAEGDGRAVWRDHVEPARVDAGRVASHLALVELLEGRAPAARMATWTVEVADHGHSRRGALALCWGQVALTHGRTGRRTEHSYAAVHLGGLEVLGATRAADPDRDRACRDGLRQAFEAGAPVTTLLRMVSDGYGPREFGLDAALPEVGDHFLDHAARGLVDRFVADYDRLFTDHRPMLASLAAAGYQLPAELRSPAELALSRRLEAEVLRAAATGSLDPADYSEAVAVAAEARRSRMSLAAPGARAALDRLVLEAVTRALRDGTGPAEVLAGRELARGLGLELDLDRAQEMVHDHAVRLGLDPGRAALAESVGLAVAPG